MQVSSLSSWLHRWLNAAKMMICKLCLIVSALTVGWSVMGIFGEQSGLVLPASAETPAERCAKRGMVLVGRSCETPKKKAESPAERCAKRGMVLVGRSCETPKKKAESPAERCAKRGMVLVGRSCETPKKKAESPAERCAKRGMILVGRSCETPKKKKAETSQQRCAKQNKKC